MIRETSNRKGFSLVICTHNGVTRLKPTLTHVAALKKPEHIDVEVLLVDNASTDDTAAFGNKCWDDLERPFPLRTIEESRPGKGFAIETGYDAARYAWLITVDDDNWLRDDYLVNALSLINTYTDVGIFQAGNKPVFETPPPAWLKNMDGYMVIGSPVKKPGYFPDNYYGVWGAGMIIFKDDWQYLRSLGFAALTSKVSGKAAGEDVELAFGLLLMGRKIYYADCLCYRHFMPTARLSWNSMEKGFATFGFTDYYFFLYRLVFDAFDKNYAISAAKLKRAFLVHFLKLLKSQGLKDNFSYLFKKEKAMYRLKLKQYYSAMCWFYSLSGRAMEDIQFIQRWLAPLLQHNPNRFRM